MRRWFWLIAIAALIVGLYRSRAVADDPAPGIEGTAALPLLVEKPDVAQQAAQAGSGSVILGPSVSYHGSGPYRALYSANGYSGIAATVSLPCNASQMRQGEELGYIYLGGWGAGPFGRAVDAGLQKGRIADGVPTHDVYHLILNYQGQWHVPSPPYSIACGQNVALRFEADNGKLRLSTGGVTAVIPANPSPITEPTTESIQVPVAPGDGWLPGENSATNGTLVKRMVTIGQPLCWFGRVPGAKGYYARVNGWDADGSFFGHHPNERAPLIQWSHTQLGVYNERTGQWQWADVSGSNVVRADVYPAGHIWMTPGQGSQRDETTAIDLGGQAAPTCPPRG